MQTNRPTIAVRTGMAMGASALVMGLALLGSDPAFAQTVTLRWHTHVPPVAASYKILKAWVDKVEKDSKGRLKIF